MPGVSREGIRQANLESRMAKNRQLRRVLETNRQQQAMTNTAEVFREREELKLEAASLKLEVASLKLEVSSLKKALSEASDSLAEASDKLTEASERAKQLEHERKRASDLAHDLTQKLLCRLGEHLKIGSCSVINKHV